MGKFTMKHEIHCDTDTFWKVFLDKEFNEKLYTTALGFPDFKVTEQTETETSYTRRVAAQPKMDVPGPVAKLIGPGFRYVEEGSMSKSDHIWKWKMIPSTLADKLFTSGTVRIEVVGGHGHGGQGHKVLRIADMNVEAKIFAVGGMIESSAEKQMRDGWDKSASFMNKWITDHHSQQPAAAADAIK